MTHPDDNQDSRSPEDNFPTEAGDGPELPFIDDREGPEYGARAKKGAKLEMATPRVTELARTALELRMADLAGLAKKNMAEGYPAAARTQMIDANVIKTELLPQLQRQLAMAMGRNTAPLPDRVAQAFQPSIESALRASWTVARAAKSDRPDDSIPDHAQRVANALADKVNEFATELYLMAYEAGLSERRSSFEYIAGEAGHHLV